MVPGLIESSKKWVDCYVKSQGAWSSGKVQDS